MNQLCFTLISYVLTRENLMLGSFYPLYFNQRFEMKTRLLLTSVLLSCIGIGLYAQDYYYWKYYQKKELTLLPSYVRLVTYDLEMDTTDLKELLGIPSVKILLHDRSYHTNMFRKEIQEYNYALLEDSLLINTDLTVCPEISFVSKNLFLNSDGKEVIFSDLFYVHVEDADSMDLYLLDSMALANRVDYLGHFLYGFYGLKCTKESAGDALEMANLFYESGLFEYAEADLMIVHGESLLGITAVEQVPFKIYTSAGELVVEPPAGFRLLELYSVQGIKLGSYPLNQEKTFRLKLPPGMYLYKIHAGQCFSGKLLLP